ncbi:MAG: hypothetical protein D6739_03760, partial [Nitrospirae bacterium]
MWQASLERLAGDLSYHDFTKWIEPLKVRVVDDETLCLEATDRFAKEWVEERFLGRIRGVVREASQGRMRVTLG